MPYTLACGHQVAHERQPHYCNYLRLDELLHLQPPSDQLRHPDEHLFVTIHQSTELWFKQILFELQRCIEALDADNVGLAIWLIRRINRIGAILTPTLQILDTMAPSDFFAFRPNLAPASGAEGQQYREIEILIGLRDPAYRQHLERSIDASNAAATQLWTKRMQSLWESRSLRVAFADLFERRNLRPEDVYVIAPQPNLHAELFMLIEELLDLDETMILWRIMHARIAERAIGPALSGTGNSPGVSYLDSTSSIRRFFPELWQIRTHLWERREAPAYYPPAEQQPACPLAASISPSGSGHS